MKKHRADEGISGLPACRLLVQALCSEELRQPLSRPASFAVKPEKPGRPMPSTTLFIQRREESILFLDQRPTLVLLILKAPRVFCCGHQLTKTRFSAQKESKPVPPTPKKRPQQKEKTVRRSKPKQGKWEHPPS